MRADAFVEGLDARVEEILDRCSRCGRCVEVCPTAEPAGVDRRDPAAVVGEVLDILRGAAHAESRGARWAETCTGSGTCIDACDDGVNPRFMLAMARLRLNARGEGERRAAGQAAFNTMSRAVKVLSSLQLPAEIVGRVTRSAHTDAGTRPDVVFYVGCNVMRTPHIALLAMDVLDRVGVSYRVFGGPANCCGVIQWRAGDTRTGAAVAANTVSGFAATGASEVLTWCPTCTIQLGETVLNIGGPPRPPIPPDGSEAPRHSLGGPRAPFSLGHVVPFIADRLDRLVPHFVRPVPWRIALHEHPGVAGVTEAVLKILGAIPGLTIVDLAQPRVGYMCNSLAPVPAYKRQLQEQELRAAETAGVDALVGIYHACHRELCAHETVGPFRVVNFLEIVGEAMGIERRDLFKEWKMMQDVDRVLAEVAPQATAAGLDLGAVREVMTASLGEQPLPVRRNEA